MEHPSHEHPLILNVNYIAREGDKCRGCNEQIVSCKSSVYSCSRSSITDATSADKSEEVELFEYLSSRTSTLSVSCAKFLLHKSCAELPAFIQNPTNPRELLKLYFNHSRDIIWLGISQKFPPSCSCNVCGIPLPWDVRQFFYCISDTNVYVCHNCALFQLHQPLEDRKFEHPAHSQHPLALIQRPSSFICDACKVEDNNKDLSYICTKCQFWIHKSCVDAPRSFQFQFHHQHPLVLSFSLPRVYHKFIHRCRLCNKTLNDMDWLYYCRYCRYFAHFHCARSSQMSSSGENEEDNSDLVHLPAADELSAILLGEEFVKRMSSLCSNKNDDNNDNISSSPNSIKHWSHDEHHLQLMSMNDFRHQKDNDKTLLKCDGCVKLIRADDDHRFYGCVPCKYVLHTFCAELPRKIKHYVFPGRKLYAEKLSEKYMLFRCDACGFSSNGIFFTDGEIRLQIGCASLPKMIKHEAHSHKLDRVEKSIDDSKYCQCRACGEILYMGCNHECEECDFYICERCIMEPRRVNHPWDPHPLQLIYEPGMVTDHEHDFSCELCSEDIDTNFWFYHCAHCDLSLHLDVCFERSRYNAWSNTKFGATDIIIHKLHPHGLTFVWNKKVRRCDKCDRELLWQRALECNAAPCKAIFCLFCCQ